MEAALPVMADVALRPTFPEAELDRLRQERLTSLLQARDDAAQVAPMAFARVVFGDTHRYGTSAMGTTATLKAFTTSDLRLFHSSMYQPSATTLVVVGDVTANTVLPLLEKSFGGWRAAGAATRTPVAQAPQLSQAQVTIVDMPGAEQSQVRIGWVGVPRSTTDYFTLQVLNTILGGSFTSRLNQNLREKNQFTYGASSRFDMRLSAGPFFAGAGIQTDKTTDALREFFSEVKGIATPVSAAELTKAKNYVALGFPSEFETIQDLAAHIEEMIVYKLPDNYFERYIANIQAVTADDVIAPNTRQQLAEADLIMQDRIHRQLRDSGVTIVSSDNVYIESAVSIGPDTIIRPFTFIGRGANIGAECSIGPFACVPRDAIVPEGTTVAGNVTAESIPLTSGRS